ncbi:MAG: HNH endonuclease signature motif containing protein [Clostridiaceae bacterium]
MSRYPEEIHRFIADNVKGTTTRDLVELVNSKFGTDFTVPKMKSYKCNHKLKSGTPLGVPSGLPTELYPVEIRKYIEDNHAGIGPKEMSELLNNMFGTDYTKKQIKAYYGNHDLSSGVTGYFPEGHTPPNKGMKGHYAPGSEKSWFKKGNVPKNLKPVGSERVDVEGYTLIKTAEPSVWKLKHKLLWEVENGEVPEGYVLTFLDKDKSNISLDNLALITMAESLQLTRSNLRSINAEYTKTGILITKVMIARCNRKKANT